MHHKYAPSHPKTSGEWKLVEPNIISTKSMAQLFGQLFSKVSIWKSHYILKKLNSAKL